MSYIKKHFTSKSLHSLHQKKFFFLGSVGLYNYFYSSTIKKIKLPTLKLRPLTASLLVLYCVILHLTYSGMSLSGRMFSKTLLSIYNIIFHIGKVPWGYFRIPEILRLSSLDF